MRKPGQQLEYLPYPDKDALAETLVAFANSDGGTIVLGVTPEGKPTGAFSSEDLESILGEAVMSCTPPVEIGDTHVEEVADGLEVYTLRVPRSQQLHSLADGRVLVRSGSHNRPLEGEGIRRLAVTKSTGDFEQETVAGATIENLDDEVIAEYMEKREERTGRAWKGTKESLLRAIGALDENGKPTVAGMLLFGKEPYFFLPQSGLTFVHFLGDEPRGKDGSVGYIRREEIHGPLARIIERAWQVIWEDMVEEPVFGDLARKEVPEYPKVAVREALVNAVCHRDYRIVGRRIEVRMFSDRLEIVSPGGLPGYITLDNILEEHYSRNPRIVNGLMQWGYIEELGLGMDRIFESLARNGQPPPKLESTPFRFTLTMYNSRKPVLMPEWERNMNERQLRALQYLQEHGRITNREYHKLCPDVSTETLRLGLVDLVEKGILLKIGEKKGTYYILK